jgi:hypothetical protein
MRPITVSVGGLAAASANAISLSQKVSGAQALAIDGAYSTGYSATNIATTTGNGAGTTTVTLNGSTTQSGVAYLSPAAAIVVTSAGNDVARTVTITGLAADGLTAQSETIQAANASRSAGSKLFSQVNSVVLSGTSAGTVSVGTNGTAINAQPRNIVIASAGNDTGVTFTVTGTDYSGNPITETITGASGASATSVLVYKTVTSITASGTIASTVTAGTSAVSASNWVYFDGWSLPNIAIQCTVSGTVNYTIQATLDDPNSPTNPIAESAVTWINTTDTLAVNATSSLQSNFFFVPAYARILLNSGTGTVTATFNQSGNVIQ